jgi:adenosylcobinamide-GDP ribazoletransferase
MIDPAAPAPGESPDAAASRATRAGAMRPLADARLAFQFLTRFPVGKGAPAGADLGRSCAWFPLAGAAMGLVVAGAAWAVAGRVPAPLAGVLAAAALAWMSGGLHLDGLADLFDGLSGGHGDRERILAIMRDGRIGAHGAAALALVLLAKAAALAELVARGDPWVLVAAPAVARFVAVPLVVHFPYARPEGLGKPFHGTAGAREVAVAAILAAAALAPTAPASLASAAAAHAAAGALALTVRRRLGGLTGDVYGAAIELAEVAFLSVAALR